MLFFLLVFFIIFTIISYYNIRRAVFLVLALLPSYLIRFQLFGIPMTALETMILIIFIVWLIKNFKFLILNFKSIFKFSIFKQYKLFLISCFLFLISATIGMFVAPDLREAAGIWKAYFIEPVLFFVVLISEFRAKSPPCPPLFKGGVGGFNFIISALSISAFYISIYAILQRFFGVAIPAPWQAELRVTSIFPYPNAVGLYLAPIVPLFIYQLISRLQITDYRLQIFKILDIGYWTLIIFLSLVSIYLAKTEAALVALAAGLFFFLLLYNNKTRLVLVLLIILLSVFGLQFSDSASFVTIKDKLLLNDWSGKVRLTMWSETWEMLKDRPILGAGLSGYQTAILPYHKAGWMEVFLYPHNIVCNFWSEIGLLGLLSFVAIIVLFFWNLKFEICHPSGDDPQSQNLFGNFLPSGDVPKGQKLEIRNYSATQLNRGLLLVIASSMVVLIIHGLVDVPYFKNDLSVLFWTIIALPIIIKNDKLV